jgi:hypothetical protein
MFGARPVSFPQDGPPDEILRDPGHASVVSLAQGPGYRALAGARVAAKHDEPRLIGPDSHAADPRCFQLMRRSRFASQSADTPLAVKAGR